MATQEQSESVSSNALGSEYLECLHALAGELEGAMKSLAVNGLSSFEESVSRQLVLCSRLSTLSEGHESRRANRSLNPAASLDEDLGIRIEDAKAKVLKLNRNYSALLSHMKRTVQMFAGLARCYSGYPHAGAVAAPNRTWSAEM